MYWISFKPLVLSGVFLLAFLSGGLRAVVRQGDLSLWLRLDEESGTTAADASGAGNEGTLVKMDDADWVDGKFGKALDFDGVDDHVTLGADVGLGLDNPAEFTLSAWIKLDRAGNFPMVFSKDGTELNLRLNANTRLPALRIEGANHTVAAGNEVPVGEWHQVASTFNDRDNQVRLYIDGAKVGEFSFNKTVDTTGKDAFVGRRSDGYYFPGVIDDLRVYQVALSDTEVAELYGDGDGDFGTFPVFTAETFTASRVIPVALDFKDATGAVTVEGFNEQKIEVSGGTLHDFWKVDDSRYLFDVVPGNDSNRIVISIAKGVVNDANGKEVGSGVHEIQTRPSITAQDTIGGWWPLDGAANNLTPDIVSGMDFQVVSHETDDWQAAKMDQGLVFDGSDEYLLLPDVGNLLAGSYSISIWANIESIDDRDILSASPHGVLLEVGNNSKLRFLHRNPSGAGDGDNFHTGAVLVAKEWLHLAAVRDSDGKVMKMYIDGAEAASLDTTSTAFGSIAKGLAIGRLSTTNNARRFHGQLDDLRIYRSALSAEDVVKIYGDGKGDIDKGPVVTLAGDALLWLNVGTDWVDPGATVTDEEDGDLGAAVADIEGNATTVDMSQPGTWRINYRAEDSSGTAGWARRVVKVVQPGTPILKLNGTEQMIHEAVTTFTDPGVTITDIAGNPVAGSQPVVTGGVNIQVKGNYVIKYEFTNEQGRVAEPVSREVQVVDTTPPELTLKPDARDAIDPVTAYLGKVFEDPGVTSIDTLDGAIEVTTSTGALPTDGLLAYWRMEAILDGKLPDSHGGDHDLSVISISGFTEVSAGRIGHALDLDGGGGYAEIVPDAAMKAALEGDCTITAWAWSRVAAGSIEADLAYVMDVGDSHGQGMGIVFNKSHGTFSAGTLSAYRNGNEITAFKGPASEWFHVTMVANGAFQRLYVNGVLSDEQPGGPITLSAARTFRLGIESKSTNRPWDGLIDEMALWERALSANEIAQVHAGNADALDTTLPGEHRVWYSATDASGNTVHDVSRQVIVTPDPGAPVLTLVGDVSVTHEAGSPFEDPGVTVTDSEGNPLEDAQVQVEGIPDGQSLGTFTIAYNHQDTSGRQALNVSRQVTVVDTVAPVITLNGPATIHVGVGASYLDAGATALDILDGDLLVSSDILPTVVGLVLHWSLDDLDGTRVTDSSGLENHGTLNGTDPATVVVDGKLGKAIDLQTLNGYIDLPHNDSINLQELTAACWFKSTDNGAWYRHLFGKYGYSPGTPFWGLGWMGSGSIGFTVRDSNNTRSVAKSPTGWGLDGEWHHIVGVRAAGKVKFYGDGVFVAEVDDTTGDIRNTRQISIGRHSNTYAKVSIDEVRLYNRGLKDSEVAVLHSGGGLDTSVAGEKIVTYTAFDSSGNLSTTERKVIVTEDPLPTLRLTGEAEVIHEAGVVYPDPGVDVFDPEGNVLADAQVHVTGFVDSMILGTQVLTYGHTDTQGRAVVPVVRRVTVVDTSPPVIVSNWGERFPLAINGKFEDPGVTVTDNLAPGDIVSIGGWKRHIPIARWTFDDEGDSTKVLDVSGNGHDGTLLGNALRVDGGRQGRAVRFNGGIDRMDVPDHDALDLSTFTLAAWIKAEDAGGTADYPTLFTHAESATVRNWWVALNKDGGVFWKDSVGGQFTYFQEILPEAPNLKSGEWIHLACVRDGAGQLARLFIDGKMVGEKTGIATDSTMVANPVRFGNNENLGRPFKGLMDEIQIFNAALPDEELAALPSGTFEPDTSFARELEYVYHATDSTGNIGELVLTVVVTDDLEPPVITLVGDAEVRIEIGKVYEDEGVIAQDSRDGNLTPFVDDGGTLDAVKTATPAEFFIRYTVSDFSGNKAVEISRKVVVFDPVAQDPFDAWLADLPEESRQADADPDGDGFPNLLEYALGGDPAIPGGISLPTISHSGDTLSLTLVRLKVSEDSALSLGVQETDVLGSGWTEVATTLKGALQGINQDSLPDGKDFATSRFERVQLEVSVDRARRFFRVSAER